MRARHCLPIAVTALLVWMHAAHSQPAASLPTTLTAARHELSSADLGAWLEGLMHHGLEAGDIAGAVVSVVKDGRILFESGYGYADVRQRIPMDPERTLTRIGSTSKLFTWTAVMQLVEQGKLDLDRNVDDYLDFKVSPPGHPIRLIDLMNHRGGFEEGLKDVLRIDPKGLPSTRSYLEGHPRPILYPPGSVPAYSNYGTTLAGYIVERVSGEPYERYIAAHILEPLGMRHSTFEEPLPEGLSQRMSRGYRTASTPAQPFELVVTRPAGSGTSTAADMARFMLVHLEGGRLDGRQILAPGTEQLMQTASAAVPPGFATLAHGFLREMRNGRIMIGHGGDTIYFHTELELLPQEGVGIFYSFNSRGRDSAVYGLRKQVLDQFMDRYFPSPAPASVIAAIPSARLDARRIAGRYQTSRRVEHGFLGIFYLAQQVVIDADADGSISAPRSLGPGVARFREVAPDLWREQDGTRELAVRDLGGVMSVLDSEDPTSVLQRVPRYRSGALNLAILSGSLLVLLLAALIRVCGHGVRRHYGRSLDLTPEAARARRLLGIAVAVDLLWLIGWVTVLWPVLSVQLDFYSTRIDPLIRSLQLGGLAVLFMTALALLSLSRLSRAPTPWPARMGHGLTVAAMLGLVWVGIVGGLIGFDLNY